MFRSLLENERQTLVTLPWRVLGEICREQLDLEAIFVLCVDSSLPFFMWRNLSLELRISRNRIK